MTTFTQKLDMCCGWSGRTLTTILVAGGIVCSVYTALSCEFFQFEVAPEHKLPGLLFSNTNADNNNNATTTTEGYVGLFGFSLVDGECWQGKDQGFSPAGFNELFLASQVCAVAAPSFAFVALFLNLVEIFCRFSCSFFMIWFCLVLAVAAQGCTFLIYGQTEFCFDDGAIACEFGIGAILSVVAAGSYYLASIILCCMPRIDPCLYSPPRKRNNNNNNSSHNKDDDDDGSDFDNEQLGNSYVQQQQQQQRQSYEEEPQEEAYVQQQQQQQQSYEEEPQEEAYVQQQQQQQHSYEEESQGEADHYEPEISFGHGGNHDTESFQNNNTGNNSS